MTIDRTTPIEHLPELLRVSEVAQWLGVSTWVAYDYARRDVLPSVRLGRRLLIQRRGLAALAGRDLDRADRAADDEHHGGGDR